jgi:hypothetical protein
MKRLFAALFAFAAVAAALSWTNTGDLASARIVRDISIGPGGGLYAAALIDTGPATYRATVYYANDLFNWDSVNTITGAPEIISQFLRSNDTLYAGTRATGTGTWGGWLYYSANGTTWTPRSRISGTGMGDIITALTIDALGRFQTGSNYMGMATVYPYFSSDRGNTWTRATSCVYSADIQCMFKTSTGALYFGSTFGSQLRVSTDNGVNWVQGSVGMSGNAKSDLCEASGGALFAAARTNPASGWIYRSTDAGANWVQVYSTGSALVRSLCYASDGNVYAGLGGGTGEVLVSTDGGTTWASAGTLTGATDVYRLLDVDVSGTHYLYAATGPNGDVFRAALSGVVLRDVGATRILAPAATMDSAASVVPACSVYNYGATTESYRVRLRIGAAYNDTARVSGHGPGTRQYVTFPAWANPGRGSYAMTCSTELAGDAVPSNDRATGSVQVNVHDLAAVAIVAPSGTVLPVPVQPQATVRNRGTVREAATVHFSIDATPAYRDSVVLAAGLPFADTTLQFAAWSAVPGSYTARCSTALATDQVPANDAVEAGFTVTGVNAAALAIRAPTGTMDTSATIVPQARVQNRGDAAADLAVFLRIDSAGGTLYSDAASVTGLGPGDSAVATFVEWGRPHPVGAFTVRCSVWVALDQNPADDTLSAGFTLTGDEPLEPGWREMAPVPSAPSGRAVKDGGWLARDNDLVYCAKGYKTSDFYAYEPRANGWTELAPIPTGTEGKPPYKGAAACGDNNGTLYATKGNNTQGFWSYSVGGNEWTQLADVPLGTSNKKVKGGTDLVYVAGDSDYVYLLKGYKTEFYRYSVAGGQWQALPDAPPGARPKWDKGSWLVRGDENAIRAHKARYHEYYAFDLEAQSWGPVATGMPLLSNQTGKSKKSKDGGSAAWLDDRAYSLKGGNTQDFFSWDPGTQAWAELETMPAFGSTAKRKRVKAGGDLLAYDNRLFALKGNKTLEFWRYVPGAAGQSPTPESQSPKQGGQNDCRLQIGDCRLQIVQTPSRGGAKLCLTGLPQGTHKLAVYDASGREVLRRAIDNRQSSFDIALSPGVCLARLTGPGGTATAKLTVR